MPGRVFLPHKAYFGLSRWRYAVPGNGDQIDLGDRIDAGLRDADGVEPVPPHLTREPSPALPVDFLLMAGRAA